MKSLARLAKEFRIYEFHLHQWNTCIPLVEVEFINANSTGNQNLQWISKTGGIPPGTHVEFHFALTLYWVWNIEYWEQGEYEWKVKLGMMKERKKYGTGYGSNIQMMETWMWLNWVKWRQQGGKWYENKKLFNDHYKKLSQIILSQMDDHVRSLQWLDRGKAEEHGMWSFISLY